MTVVVTIDDVPVEVWVVVTSFKLRSEEQNDVALATTKAPRTLAISSRASTTGTAEARDTSERTSVESVRPFK